MNAIKLRLICLVLMCVGLCPRAVMAENHGHSGKYREIESVKISTDQEGKTVGYTIGLYSINWNTDIQQRQHLDPDEFLFAQNIDSSKWWFAVKYKIKNSNICSYSNHVKGNNYPEVVKQAERLEFFSELGFNNPKDFDGAVNKITNSIKNKFNIDITEDDSSGDNGGSSSGDIRDHPFQNIRSALNSFFNGCTIFIPSYVDDKVIKENADRVEKIDDLEEELENKKTDISRLDAELTKQEDLNKELQVKVINKFDKLGPVSNSQDIENNGGSEYWSKILRKFFSELFPALIGLLMIAVVAGGFLFWRKIMKSYRAVTEQTISNDMHNFEKQQEEMLREILKRVQNIYTELEKTPIRNVERMPPNYQNTNATQAKALPSAVQTRQKQLADHIGEKLAAHIDPQLKVFLSDVQKTQNTASEKLATDIDLQFRSFISRNEKLEQLKRDYEKEKDSRLHMQTQLKDAKAGQEQARESFRRLEYQVDDLKKKSVRIYQQGGLSDEESENLAPERLAELGSLYIKRPTVLQYGLAINALKKRLGDLALADEPFFKAVGLNVLQEKLSEIHHFRKFYETDEFSAYLVGHWKDNIQLIFRACLLLESYFQLDMQNPVLIDLRLARSAATKLLYEHGLIPDDFQLPAPSHEFECKFEVAVHGDIPADLANHPGFKDKVQALRRSGEHKVVCYVNRWGLSAQAGAPYKDDLPGTVLKSLEKSDQVVQRWGD